MPKPHIDQVLQAFQDFQGAVIRASQNREWYAFHAARDTLKTQLDEMGLAEHIDWTDPAE